MLENEKNKGETGLELTNLQWLIDHHRTKEQERLTTVENLGLKPGNILLDLGSGPGLWTHMFAEKVKPDGRVIGLDFSQDLINYAVKELEKDPLKDIIEFRLSDFYDVPFADDKFDLVFFGNCLAYVADFSKVMKEMKRVTKNGGRIAVKDFDGALFIINPIDPELSLKVLTAMAKALKENPPEPMFENFVGRKIHGLLLQEGLFDVSTTSCAVQKLYPLSPEAKRYITGNAEWLAKIGSPYLSEKELKQWMDYFNPNSENYVLDLKEFYFCMLEVLTIGTVEK